MSAPQPVVSTAKILAVDDNPGNLLLLESMLKRAGYENVECVTDPRKVKPLYAKRRHDLILLDIRMPHLNGLQVMEQLAEVAGNDYLPILVLTAYADRETRLQALEKGAKDFLTKPFDNQEALNRVRNLLEVRLLHNKLRDQNLSLEEMVHERTRELEDTRLEIIQRLGRAAEYRDNETGMHVIRMSHFCALLAETAGMGEKGGNLLLHASPMHDVGKIGIPDYILLKEDELNEAEWEVMKSHTEIGGKILSHHNSELLETARIVALTHHEKWDGSGYPKGIKGEEIPLTGRIVALCDVFDALTSKRPYKDAWPVEKAVEEIKRGADTHFDSELVTAFLKVLPEILRIREKYNDEIVTDPFFKHPQPEYQI